MIGLEHDDRIICQSEFVDVVQQTADARIQSRDERVVQVARVWHIFVSFEPLWFPLIRVVRRVHREIHEERFLAICADELRCFRDHHVWKELTGFADAFVVSPEIVPIRSAPVEEVSEVVDAAARFPNSDR